MKENYGALNKVKYINTVLFLYILSLNIVNPAGKKKTLQGNGSKSDPNAFNTKSLAKPQEQKLFHEPVQDS